MTGEREQMMGFEAGDRELPSPLVGVTDETRARLVNVLTAVVHGATPEEVAGYLEDGFPAETTGALDRPGEREEIDAHVDLLLAVLQAPAVTTA